MLISDLKVVYFGFSFHGAFFVVGGVQSKCFCYIRGSLWWIFFCFLKRERKKIFYCLFLTCIFKGFVSELGSLLEMGLVCRFSRLWKRRVCIRRLGFVFICALCVAWLEFLYSNKKPFVIIVPPPCVNIDATAPFSSCRKTNIIKFPMYAYDGRDIRFPLSLSASSQRTEKIVYA